MKIRPTKEEEKIILQEFINRSPKLEKALLREPMLIVYLLEGYISMNPWRNVYNKPTFDLSPELSKIHDDLYIIKSIIGGNYDKSIKELLTLKEYITKIANEET